MIRYLVKVKGIVQGVGFRPHIYTHAKKNNLSGWVINDSSGVTIELQGNKSDIFNFLDKLKNNPPSLSQIEEIYTTPINTIEEVDFEIRESNDDNFGTTLVSPDIAICNECIEDMNKKGNLRYRYPFTNCTNCGPRYTIIRKGIYDRRNTTMGDFNFCDECNKEYRDVENRRFHAEATCCIDCGPKLWVTNKDGNKIVDGNDESIKFIIDRIKEGKIIAIKALGGFQLACNAFNNEAVKELRRRKNRPNKPFAVMIKSIEEVKKYCNINDVEKRVLLGNKKPIVILPLKRGVDSFEDIAPNRNTIGVMLPYTALHMLIFDDINIKALVMTSGNVSGNPIEYKNNDALLNLKDIADYFLFNNRDIVSPIDDSVVRVILGVERVFRRARGYSPKALDYKCKERFLSLGANMQSTFAMTKSNHVFLSPYNGNLEDFFVYKEYEKRISHYKKIFNFNEDIVVWDKHNGYMSSKLGSKISKKGYQIYHHHAHIVACMMENNITEKVIGVAFDGTGLGKDGNIWGGEILTCDYLDFQRQAHLNYITLPGGDKAIKEIWRIGAFCIYNSLKDKMINNKYTYEEIIYNLYGEKGLNILKVIKKNINSPKASSVGRLFDAVASIIGLVQEVSYEGQGAIELESLIDEELNINDIYKFNLTEEMIEGETDTYTIIDYCELINGIISDVINNVSKSIISIKFHNSIIRIVLDICNIIRDKTGIKNVALSGGCFQNKYLLENIILILEKNNFTVYSHGEIPANDGGISLGQIGIASAIYNKENGV